MVLLSVVNEMKLYMIKKYVDGKTLYRSSGVYDKWTHCGKCWSGGSFKSFLNYSKLILDKLLSQACFVIEIDLDTSSITQIPIQTWYVLNMNKGEIK